MFEVEAGADEKQQIKFVWPNEDLEIVGVLGPPPARGGDLELEGGVNVSL